MDRERERDKEKQVHFLDAHSSVKQGCNEAGRQRFNPDFPCGWKTQLLQASLAASQRML